MSERQKEAYRKLAEVVQEFSDLDEQEDGADHSMPTAWVLVVGYEGMDEEMAMVGGSVGMYPKDGCMASWKTEGILGRAIKALTVITDG